MYPTLVIERQEDLFPDALRAMLAVEAPHHVLEIVPRAPIDIRRAIGRGHYAGRGGCWHRSGACCSACGWGYPDDPLTPRRSRPDIVVVRGPAGPNAWPIHPTWVRKIRDACAAASVPQPDRRYGAQQLPVTFVFEGWGDFVPENEAPAEINGCARRRQAWIAAGAVGPRPDPVGNDGVWWKDGTVSEWGALAPNGTYAQYATPWNFEVSVYRVGAARSGRSLDGVEHTSDLWPAPP